jgi:succinoglycan biosynthesis protein ExoW
MPSGRVAVIIPFYQRDAGILRRAMDSVLAQDLPPDVRVHVFIVDDTSPLPPAQDLDGLTPTDRVTWSVHPQANTGPGGARNRGLDLAEAQGFDWIAFLDSDDSWTPPHLAEALAALDRGYGMYFCDNGREGMHDSYNAQVAALRDRGAAIRAKAREISEDGLTMGFPAGALAAEMIAECLCHTSAVVLRTATLDGMRFDTEQRRAGEDHLLWINLALDGPAMVISWRRNVICGTGVNIFYASFDWNSPSTMGRIGYKLLFLNKLRQMPRAMRLAETEVMTEWRRYRRAYGFLFIRNLLRGRRPSIEVLGKLMRFDPVLPLRMPFLFARIAFSRDPAIRDW